MMKLLIGRLALLAGLAVAAAATFATDSAIARTTGQDARAANMRVYGPSQAPIGHVVFCQAYPTQCDAGTSSPRQPILTQESWDELMAVNDHVNQTVIPVTDMDLYRTIEHWTYPQGAGDCEDYVLEKQRMLAALGWPIESLLITVVRDENGDGHAILTVTTDRGDLLLDNRRNSILRWQQSGYTFRKRQSQTDSSKWVSLTSSGGRFFTNIWQLREAMVNVSATSD